MLLSQCFWCCFFNAFNVAFSVLLMLLFQCFWCWFLSVVLLFNQCCFFSIIFVIAFSVLLCCLIIVVVIAWSSLLLLLNYCCCCCCLIFAVLMNSWRVLELSFEFNFKIRLVKSSSTFELDSRIFDSSIRLDAISLYFLLLIELNRSFVF